MYLNKLYINKEILGIKINVNKLCVKYVNELCIKYV